MIKTQNSPDDIIETLSPQRNGSFPDLGSIFDFLGQYVKKVFPLPTAQCVLCKVYFSAQPNKLRPILKFEFGIPLNINLSQLVRVCGKYIFFTFLWFWNSRSVISLKYVPVSSPASLNMPLYPPFFWLYRTGWKNLAAFRREQKWQWKFSSSAYLQFSRQMRRFCA